MKEVGPNLCLYLSTALAKTICYSVIIQYTIQLYTMQKKRGFFRSVSRQSLTILHVDIKRLN